MFYKYLRSFKDILLIIGIIFHDKLINFSQDNCYMKISHHPMSSQSTNLCAYPIITLPGHLMCLLYNELDFTLTPLSSDKH